MSDALRAELVQALPQLRCIVVVGLPGTGKSLLIRDLARSALAQSRRVSLLQWDVARMAWDTPGNLARYPEIDGVTHAALRAAAGLWVRESLSQWFATHRTEDLLIVEAPIIGGRFAELARTLHDELEPELRAHYTRFVIVAPTRELQSQLRRRRAAESERTQHALEQHNASVAVIDVQMAAIERAADALGIAVATRGAYDPDLYVEVMQRVLRHRPVQVLRPERLIETGGSVYQFAHEPTRLSASAQQVAASMQRAGALDEAQLREQVESGWSLT